MTPFPIAVELVCVSSTVSSGVSSKFIHNIHLCFVDDSLPTIITLPLHSPKPVMVDGIEHVPSDLPFLLGLTWMYKVLDISVTISLTIKR